MLYNPHKCVPSRESFAAWLETMPANEFYWWVCPASCACGQYAKHFGVFKSWISREADLDGPWYELDLLAALRPRTFGGLLQRVRQLMAAP